MVQIHGIHGAPGNSATMRFCKHWVYSSLWLAIYQWVYLSSAAVYDMYCNVVSVLHLWYWIFYYSIYRSVSIASIVSILHCILVPVCTALHCIVVYCCVMLRVLIFLLGYLHLCVYPSIYGSIHASSYQCMLWYPLVNIYITNWKTNMLLMGKSTISTGPFSIAMLNYQRVSK
jgi:hypothetical protein